jgi:hypothetical protein
MSMQTDVKSGAAAAGATTTIFDGPARIKGVTISYSTGGTVVLNDGTGGTAMLSFTAPAAAGSVNIIVPGEGIKCSTNISAVVSATTTAVVFYG